MIDPLSFKELDPNPQKGIYPADYIPNGIPVPKTRRVELFSPDEWEEFTEEWASSLKGEYFKVVRFAGAGDKGLDVVGFIGGNTFAGGWDNYQCKHYDKALSPSKIWVELGKIIYYSHIGEYPVPRIYYFVAPKGVGTKLGKLIAKPESLKSQCKENWDKYCASGITTGQSINLVGDLLAYFDTFDFSIFRSKSLVELIEGHSNTPFHTVRFGGGLPVRLQSEPPPRDIHRFESTYVKQLYEVYSEYSGSQIESKDDLESNPELKSNFLRQRERFYHAESLRNFARDTVPTGTFENLQEEVFYAVIEVCESGYPNGFNRMQTTISQSGSLPIESNLLKSVTKTQDKQGICHQLANESRLVWVKNDEN